MNDSYRIRPLPLNIDMAVACWRESGASIRTIIKKLRPIIQFWLEYPGYGSAFNYAQAFFEQRLLKAGYDLEAARNGSLRFIPASDLTLCEGDIKNKMEPLPFRHHPIWHASEESEEMGNGFLFFPIAISQLHTLRHNRILGKKFDEFMWNEVGICFLPRAGIFPTYGFEAMESEYLRWWKRGGLSFDEIMENIEYLIDLRWKKHGLIEAEYLLEWPANIPAGAVHWGSPDSAFDRIGFRGCTND